MSVPAINQTETQVCGGELTDRVRELHDRIENAKQRAGRSDDVTIVAVTKNNGADAVTSAYHSGVMDVGENRIQEVIGKRKQVSAPVRWHFIGHLQRNKVSAAMDFHLIHSLDSQRLASSINSAANECGRIVDVLLQVNVSGEVSKYGVPEASVPEVSEWLCTLSNLRVLGVMTMAPQGADSVQLRSVFSGARRASELLRSAGHPSRYLSMGMSDDFEIAVEEGATHVRLGSALFGSR